MSWGDDSQVDIGIELSAKIEKIFGLKRYCSLVPIILQLCLIKIQHDGSSNGAYLGQKGLLLPYK